MSRQRRTVRHTFLLKGRGEWAHWDIPVNVTPRHEEGFDVYEWSKANLTYALYIRPEEIQALYIEGQRGRGVKH